MWQLAKTLPNTDNPNKYIWVVEGPPKNVFRHKIIDLTETTDSLCYEINALTRRAYITADELELQPVFAKKVKRIYYHEWLAMSNEEMLALKEE